MIQSSLVFIVIPGIILFLIILANITSHILRGSYTFNVSKLGFKLSQQGSFKNEYLQMRILDRLLKVKLIKRSKFLQLLIVKIVSSLIQCEVYTLDECLKLMDAIYKDYPNVYVGIRICPCRQARGLYDKNGLPNITDLYFAYSKTPGVIKDIRYTTFISLKQAKELLIKFDKLGLAHTLFGNCGNIIDGAFGLAICNCKREYCIPLDVAQKLDLTKELYINPHNMAIIDQDKCLGGDNCGKCLEICNFEARMIDKSNGKIKIINDKCYGCGLCANHCPKGANTMKFLPKNKLNFYQNLFKDMQEHHLLKEKL